MILQCDACQRWYDDEFRRTYCPHTTFPANDGNNNFQEYPRAYLADVPPPYGYVRDQRA